MFLKFLKLSVQKAYGRCLHLLAKLSIDQSPSERQDWLSGGALTSLPIYDNNRNAKEDTKGFHDQDYLLSIMTLNVK